MQFQLQLCPQRQILLDELSTLGDPLCGVVCLFGYPHSRLDSVRVPGWLPSAGALLMHVDAPVNIPRASAAPRVPAPLTLFLFRPRDARHGDTTLMPSCAGDRYHRPLIILTPRSHFVRLADIDRWRAGERDDAVSGLPVAPNEGKQIQQ